MCGFVGMLCRPGAFDETHFLKSLNSIIHRGPDDFAYTRTKLSEDWELWLGHRRLSILDLSESGRQPMSYKTPHAEYEIIYNGEIYNHSDLRNALKKEATFKSDSDTEVLLAGLAKQGPSYLQKLNGMWALAFIDKTHKKLMLSRDRLGKKPLYVYKSPDVVAFSSELKPLQHLGFTKTQDEMSWAYYHWLGYIPGTKTIYKEIQKFPASSFCEFNFQSHDYKESKTYLYWDPLKAYSTRFTASYEKAIDQFLELLDDATVIRSIADVPVGVFLSGGIDSSLVVSSLAAQKKQSVKVYTVAFEDKDFDESSVAQETCRQLGFELELLKLKDSDFEKQVEIVCNHYDEPFADSSQIPVLAISQIAKTKVTVILTGDGGDEVFLGYPRFSFPDRFWKYNRMSSYLPGMRTLIASTMSSSAMKPVVRALVKSTGLNPNNLDAKILRFVEILRSRSKEEVYDAIVSITPKTFLSAQDQQLLGEQSFQQHVRNFYPEYSWDSLKERSSLEKIAAIDLVSYMRDDVLVKVDRGTMAYSLEARSPLLDYRIVELGLSLPLDYKVRGGQYKALLRSALERRLPGEISRLGKKGFGVPLPATLPEGATMAARWSAFVEKAWREKYV